MESSGKRERESAPESVMENRWLRHYATSIVCVKERRNKADKVVSFFFLRISNAFVTENNDIFAKVFIKFLFTS